MVCTRARWLGAAALACAPCSVQATHVSSTAPGLVAGLCAASAVCFTLLVALTAWRFRAASRARARPTESALALAACTTVTLATLPTTTLRVAVKRPDLDRQTSFGGDSLESPSLGPCGAAAPVHARADVRLQQLMARGSSACVFAATLRGAPCCAKVYGRVDEEEAGERSSSLERRTPRREGGEAPPPGTPSTPRSAFAALATALKAYGWAAGSYERELRLLCSLRHQNLCALLGVVPPSARPGGEGAIVLMERRDTSLDRMLPASSLESLSWATRCQIGAGVAAGLNYLHCQQPPIPHYDLRSCNVLMHGLVPKVSDFSLAATDFEAHQEDDGGGAASVPTYLPPEVWLMLEAPLSALAVDSYGIGVVLHDLGHEGTAADSQATAPAAAGGVTGCAVDWSDLEVLNARLRAGSAADVALRVPPALARLTTQCLAMEPNCRPNSAEALMRLRALTTTLLQNAREHRSVT